MSKSKSNKALSRVEKLWGNSRGKRRMLILTAMLTAVMMTSGVLAQWTGVFSVTQPKPTQTGQLSPASFNANVPAKEYIYAGGKLVATEEPQAVTCTYTIGSTNQSYAAAVSSDSVTVTAQDGCTWTAFSNAGWISVTAGASGNGNGTVQFSVDANTTGAIRNGTLTIAGQTFTVFQGLQFADVPEGAPFYTEIGKLAARGVTLGCGGGNYCPAQVVNRQQMAAFIIRALHEPGYTPPTPGSQRFLDVPPENPFYAHIEEMAVRQITLGCGGGNYCPIQVVNRQQMAGFLIRALHVPGYSPPTPGAQRFPDVPPENPFYAHIEEMAVRGITLGCSTNPPLYCPTAEVTRAQMAAFLVRAFNL